MSDVDVASALFARLGTLSTTLPIQYENAPKNAPSQSGWIEAFIIRGENERRTLAYGGEHRASGFMQVTVVLPQGSGAMAALRAAADVQTHFPDGATYGGATISARPTIAQPLPDEGWYRVPVTIPYFGYY